jgi:hypothetical protein
MLGSNAMMIDNLFNISILAHLHNLQSLLHRLTAALSESFNIGADSFNIGADGVILVIGEKVYHFRIWGNIITLRKSFVFITL